MHHYHPKINDHTMTDRIERELINYLSFEDYSPLGFKLRTKVLLLKNFYMVTDNVEWRHGISSSMIAINVSNL